jgi:hypothetical protein
LLTGYYSPLAVSTHPMLKPCFTPSSPLFESTEGHLLTRSLGVRWWKVCFIPQKWCSSLREAVTGYVFRTTQRCFAYLLSG